jgi:glyoxylase-like metal-dependent hydrolase (beta-lactamase superfamily II)
VVAGPSAHRRNWLGLALALFGAVFSWQLWQSRSIVRPGPNAPVMAVTPWGQRIVPTVDSLADIATWNALKPGQTWAEGKAAGDAVRRGYGAGKIALSRTPWTVAEGVWAIGPHNTEQNIYLIDTGQGLVLIDPSLDAFQPEVLAQIAGLGFRPEQVKWVVLTHCHIDHAQSCQQWKARGAKVIIGAGDAPELAACSDVVAKGFDPRAKNRCTPCAAEQRVADGDVLQLGNLTLHAIASPGHTPGSTSFAFQRGDKWLLLSGDIALHNGRHAWMGGTQADWGLYLTSLGKLARWSVEGRPVRFDLLLPGHGAVDLDQGQRSVEQTERVVSEIVRRRTAGEKIGWLEAYPWNWQNRTSSPAAPAILPAI